MENPLTSAFGGNPWQVPRHLITFICGPIQPNKRTGGVECQPGSWPLVFKYYRMQRKLIWKVRKYPSIPSENSTTLRDLAFYQFIREHILIPGVCPNFTMLHTFPK